MEHRWIALCVLLPLFLAISYSESLISILSTPIKAQFNVANGDLGLLFSVYNMPNIVLPLLSGALASRFGAPPVVLCCMAIALIGVVVQALAVDASIFSFSWLLVGRLVFGLGAESALTCGTIWLVSCFQGHPVSLVFSLILAATSAGHLCAYAFAPLLLPSAIAANGVLETHLVAPFWIALGLMAFAFVAMLAFDCVESKGKAADADKSNATATTAAADSGATTTVDVSPNGNGNLFSVPESQRPRSSAWQRFRAMLGHCVADSFLLHTLMFAMIVIYAFQHPFWSFAPDYYQSRLGYSMVDSGRLVAVSYLVLIIASPLVNWCLERTGHLPLAMLLGALLLAFAAVAIGFNRQFHLAPSSSHLTALMIGSIALASLSSVVFHSANSAVFLALARFEHIGELYALINSLSCAATTAVNISVGYLSASDASYGQAFTLLVALVATLTLTAVAVLIADCLADGAYSAKHIAPVEHNDLFPEADAADNDHSGGTLPRHPQQTMFYPKQQQDMQRHSDSPAHRGNGGGGAYSPVVERHESRLFQDGSSPTATSSASSPTGVSAHDSAAAGGRVSVARWNSQAPAGAKAALAKAALGTPSRR